MATTHFKGPVDSNTGYEVNGLDAMGQTVVLQGDSTLDLTDATTPSKCTLASSGDGTAARGADTVIPLRIFAYVTTVLACDSTAPIVTVQDGSGNSAGLTLTFTNGDAVNDIAWAEVTDGDALTAVDLTSEDLEVEVTTAAADTGTATGEAKVFVECLLVK